MILAIDTSSALCAAGVFDAATGDELGRSVEDIGKGHAERLMAVIEAALSRAGKSYADIGKVAVSVGPGSFTGIRVGVSAARGLALALGVEAVGVSTLAAIAEAARRGGEARVIAAIDARRDELYVLDDRAGGGPAVMTVDALPSLTGGAPPLIAGSGAKIVADAFAAAGAPVAGVADIAATTADIAIYAWLSAQGWTASAPPKPPYLRGPDARPQQGFALPRAGAP